MSIATCPKCHRQVSLPVTDDHTVWVRCPLCSEQYSLRMALDHVPPALEILGPTAGAEMAMHGGEMAFGEAAMHGDAATRSDTSAHPEHAGNLEPLAADELLHADHGANGEQTIAFEHAAPEQPQGGPPPLNQANGSPAETAEHLVDFDLDMGEHPQGLAHPEGAEHPEGGEHPAFSDQIELAEHDELAQHDPAMGGLREYHAEHTIEPGGGAAVEGDPEFQFAGGEAGEHAGEDGEEHQAMGGIATLVQSAPPAKKRRKAPLAVKLVGVLVFFGFGFLGCYLVYGAFLWMHSDQFGLKQYFPKFLQNRVVDEPAPAPRHKGPDKTGIGSVPLVTPATGTTGDNPATTQTAQTGTPAGTSQTPAATPAPGDNPSATPTPPNKPAPTDLAQEKSNGKTPPLETSDDPLKTPPPDLDKPEATKPEAIAPPKLDTGPTPFDDVKPAVTPKSSPDTSEKPSTEKPSTEKPPEKMPEKPAATPDKPVATPDNTLPAPGKPATEKPASEKPSIDKPENPSATPSPEKPPEKVVEKPVIAPEKPVENPTSPEKSPIAAELASADAAVTATTQTSENLKSAAAPGAERSTVLRASVANYKAMSHLVTELGAVEAAGGADTDSAARIEQLRKKAAALAESMGSPAERDTTAMLASKWVASPSRKENGAVVVGTLVKVEPSDKGFVAHIKMPSDSKEMTFTTTKKPTAADGSPVVVLGLLNANDGGTAIEIIPSSDEKAPADK